MSPDTPPKLPRKKPNELWWLGSIYLLLVAIFVVQLVGPSPRIIVSKKTTYITTPLRPNGLPDYEKYVLEKLRDGVTPENNAAVLMWQTLGPFDVERKDWKLISEQLGLDATSAADTALTPLYGEQNRERVFQWLRDNRPDWKTRFDKEAADLADAGYSQSSPDIIYEVIGLGQSAPWRSDQLPPLAEWLKSNQAPLKLLVEASTRPRFYFPSISLNKGSNIGLVGMTLDGISSTRDVARTLSVPAMWHLGEGRHEEAWKILAAIHRWARLVGQGNTLVEQLVAVAIDGIAADGTIALLADADLPPDLARQIQRDLDALPSACRMADSFDGMERITFLDIILLGYRQGMGSFFTSLDLNSGDAEFNPLDYVSIDWNVALVKGNANFDRIAAAARLSDHAARRRALKQIEDQLVQLERQFHEPGSWIGGAMSRSKRSDLVAAAFFSLMPSTITGCANVEDRSNSQLELLRLAAALAVYQAENGTYPDTLDALVPEVLPQLPVDLYNAKPFIYQRDADGYLLYSLGENGTDDGGSNELMLVLAGRPVYDLPSDQHVAIAAKIPADADDFSIRVPRPAFKLPAPPTDE